MLIFDYYIPVAIFLAVGLIFATVALFVSKLLRPDRPNPEKLTIYECGEIPIGDTRIQFSIRFYLYAILFVIFDVETIFLYPWAIVFFDIGLLGFIEMMIFLGILTLGLAYPWRKGVLKWL